MENNKFIMGTLAFFIVAAFFGGYYIGAVDMCISFEMDDNTMNAVKSLNNTANTITNNINIIPDIMKFPSYDCEIIVPFIGETKDNQEKEMWCDTRSYKQSEATDDGIHKK